MSLKEAHLRAFFIGQKAYFWKKRTMARTLDIYADSTYSRITDLNGSTILLDIGGGLGETGSFDHHFGNGDMNAEEVTLQPGEWITVAAKASTGTPAYTLASLNTREDQ